VSAPQLLAVAESAVGSAAAAVSLDDSFGTLTLDVPAERWLEVATVIHDDPRSDCDFFDWLSAYDDLESGLAVVVHVRSLAEQQSVVLRTHIARDAARLPSLTPVWRGANWHERETFEMFGISFDGHPNLVSLLLPDGFEGHPLRKEFVLASRVAKAWPGAKEPGESDHDLQNPDGSPRARRKTIQPPGVPEPGTWGPPQ
jgi:NADH-quinone oxidoreductase subunit C